MKIRLITVLLILIFAACKKESPRNIVNYDQQSEKYLTSLITQLRNWHDSVSMYSKHFNKNYNLQSYNILDSEQNINIKDINWEKAFISFDSVLKKGISVPIYFDKESGKYTQLVTTIQNEKINGYIVQSNPDLEYYKIHNDIHDFNYYSGNIKIYDFNGKFLKKFEFKNGSQVLNLQNEVKVKKSQAESDPNFTLDEVTVIGYIKDPTYLVLISTGNNGGIISSEPISELNNWIYIGGDGSQSVTPKIENFITTPCISEIVKQITDSNVANKISLKINNIFSKDDKMNLFFYERSNMNSIGESKAYLNLKGINTFNIYIDKTKINGTTSKEYIASILVHEVAHMIIASTLKTNEVYYNANTEYIMLSEYVNEMKLFLTGTYKIEEKQALSMIFSGMGWLATESETFKFWNQQNQDIFFKIIEENGLSTVFGDSNYYMNFNEQFKNGTLGTKTCN